MVMNEEQIQTHEVPEYLKFRHAVSEVQGHLAAEDWQVKRYGILPRACEDKSTHTYEMQRTAGVTKGWRLDGSTEESANQTAAWLKDAGWEGVEVEHLARDSYKVTAAKPETVEHLYIAFHTGAAADAIDLTARAACLPGSVKDAERALYPREDELEPFPFTAPETEGYNEAPVFGVDENGELQRHDAAWEELQG